MTPIYVSWNKIENNKEEDTIRALEKHEVKHNKRKKLPQWKELKEECQEKPEAYLKHKALNTLESKDAYGRKRNETK